MLQANYLKEKKTKQNPAAAAEAQRGAVIERDLRCETSKEFLFPVTTSNEGGCGSATFLPQMPAARPSHLSRTAAEINVDL